MEKATQFGHFRILTAPNLIVIKTPLWITHLFLPVFMLMAILCALTFSSVTPYIFAFAVVLVGLLYKIWIIFKPINIISIDKQHNRFLIRSRNYFQRFIDKQQQLEFSEISQFTIKEGPEFFYDPTRYIIIAIKKDDNEVVFTHTVNKNLAETLIQFFQNTKQNKDARLR